VCNIAGKLSWIEINRRELPLRSVPQKQTFWQVQIELIGDKKLETLGKENNCFLPFVK
jgi:hypothetical protein